MAQMNVSIPEPMKDWCESQVKTGRCSTVSDYVRDLIRRDQDSRQTAVQTMVNDALASGVSPHSLDEIFARAKAKAQASNAD